MSDGTPTKLRVWHAARDAYHCAFRMIRLLTANSSSAIELEWLRILDMYLLFPPLLHRSSMAQDIKARFREITVSNPEDVFGRIPSAASVYQDLRIYQNAAISYLAAKDILDKDPLRKGIANFRIGNVPQDIQESVNFRNGQQQDLVSFLVQELIKVPLAGGESIYRRAGLPARHLVS